jgi:ABC-2 type transport system ATP-binding protein
MVIQTELLTKYYDKKIGCKDISIEVEKGSVFGFLGPNGAGKSTFVKTLLGLLSPTSGKGFILGKPINNIEVRKKIGYLPENFRYQDWMTGKSLLSFHYSLAKIKKPDFKEQAQKVLKTVNLLGHENYPIKTYSKGMQQRIGIACSLISDPEVVFFDEPTSALDPLGRKEVREIIKKMKNQGKTIFLNSHLLGEVEYVCDDIAVINKGKIIKHGKIDELLKKSYKLNIEVETVDDLLVRRLKEFDQNLVIKEKEIFLNITDKNDIAKISKIIIENNNKLYKLSPSVQNLESFFVEAIERSNKNVDHRS